MTIITVNIYNENTLKIKREIDGKNEPNIYINDKKVTFSMGDIKDSKLLEEIEEYYEELVEKADCDENVEEARLLSMLYPYEYCDDIYVYEHNFIDHMILYLLKNDKPIKDITIHMVGKKKQYIYTNPAKKHIIPLYDEEVYYDYKGLFEELIKDCQ